MSVSAAYNQWAEQYDSNQNKTRDLEAFSLRTSLVNRRFRRCLEIGCGTGKNTEWLATISDHLLGIDFSEGMLEKAREKQFPSHVLFQQANILDDWNFGDQKFDLITFSLVLEHIEHLEPIFEKCSRLLAENGVVYVGELHPFKQYQGSKARFATTEGEEVVTCFIHNVSDFANASGKAGLQIALLEEYFDDNDRGAIPRVLMMLFNRKKT